MRLEELLWLDRRISTISVNSVAASIN